MLSSFLFVLLFDCMKAKNDVFFYGIFIFFIIWIYKSKE